jgi:hypothetical protein
MPVRFHLSGAFAILITAGSSGAWAQTGPGSPWPAPRPEDLDALFKPVPLPYWLVPSTAGFVSLDYSDAAVSTSYGIKTSGSARLDEPGPIWLATLVSGLGAPAGQRLRNADPRQLDATLATRLLVGWQTSAGPHYLAAFVGGEAEFEHDRASERRLYRRYGPRLEAQTWSRPTENTMVATGLAIGTARGSLWMRARLGYELGGVAYVGPEASLYRDARYRQTRTGLHISGPRFWSYTAELSGGLMIDSDKRRGGYGTLTVINRF